VFVAMVGAAFARDQLDDARFSSPALAFAATRSHTFGNVEAELAVEHAWLTAVDSEATREWTSGLTLCRGVWRAGAELGAATASGTELVERHAELSVGVALVRDFELEVAWRTSDEPGARADVFGLRIVFARPSARFRTDSPFAPYHR